LQDCAAFDDWTLMTRERLHRQAVAALEQLVSQCVERDQIQRASDYAWLLVELAPWQEEAHRQLMRLLALGGRRSAALVQYETCVHILKCELDVDPTEETTRLYEQIRDGEFKRPYASLKPSASLPVPNNLPSSLTPLIGREVALIQVVGFLQDPACRLLTLDGPGGIGKTHLALEAARMLLLAKRKDLFGHGIYFIPLASVRSLNGLIPAIAQAIGLTFSPQSDPKRELLAYVKSRNMLLLLDNLEYLLVNSVAPESIREMPIQENSVALIVELLKMAPGIKIMVTSRVRLNAQCEKRFMVTGLDYPVPAQEASDPWSFAAAKLFLSGARRVRHDYVPEYDDLDHFMQVCHKTQGLPLAILLAAAWVDMLSLAQISARLGQGLDALAADWRDLPERHRSIRAAFEPSWQMLNDAEQDAFARLSVFRSGCTAQAARQVAGARLQTLRSLVNKSLLQREASERYMLHPLLRHYALEKLERRPVIQRETHDLHCTYYAEILHQRQCAISGGELRETMPKVDNIRAAWRWAVRTDKFGEIRKSIYSLLWIFEMNGWFQEAEDIFNWAADVLKVGQASAEKSVALGMILICTRFFAARAGHVNDAGRRQVSEGMSLLRKWGTRRELAWGLTTGVYASLEEDYEKARKGYLESLAMYETLDIPWEMAHTLNMLGDWAWQHQRHRESEVYARRALIISRQLDHRFGTSLALGTLGGIAYSQDEYQEARRCFEQSLSLTREIGYRWISAFRANQLGDTFVALKDGEAARRCYEEAAAEGTSWPTTAAFYWLGDRALAAGKLEQAWYYCRCALEGVVEAPYAVQKIGALIRIATLLAREEHSREKALELATLVAERTDLSNKKVIEGANKLCRELQDRLSPTTYAAAQERGRVRDLDATVKEFLAELEEQ
jgi:predicted ATPase